MTGDCKIWKWELDITDEQDIVAPLATKFLDVQWQYDTIAIWGMFDCRIEHDLVPRKLIICGTGNRISIADVWKHALYVGTVQESNRRLVWHVFDMGSDLERTREYRGMAKVDILMAGNRTNE